MKRLHLVLAGCFGFGLAYLLSLTGCSDPTTPCHIPIPGGRIEGRVRDGGLPFEAVIAATPIVDGAEAEAIFECAPDSGGVYRLDMPAGRYLLELRVGSYRTVYDYTSTGLSYGQIPPDTVLVDEINSPLSIDFDLAGLILQLDL